MSCYVQCTSLYQCCHDRSVSELSPGHGSSLLQTLAFGLVAGNNLDGAFLLWSAARKNRFFQKRYSTLIMVPRCDGPSQMPQSPKMSAPLLDKDIIHPPMIHTCLVLSRDLLESIPASRVHPEQVTSPSQGHMQTNNHAHSQSLLQVIWNHQPPEEVIKDHLT